MDLGARIARRVGDLRARRGLSLDQLATLSGVSRSMISLVERGEASPTAIVLDRLAVALSVSIATLFEDAPASDAPAPLSPRKQQAVWRDPGSGYLRRNLSPPGYPSPIQMVEVSFPAGARVAYETAAREPRVHQQVWMLEGALELVVGDQRHALAAGDCLAMQLDRPIVFSNPGRKAARYVVVIVSEPAAAPRR